MKCFRIPALIRAFLTLITPPALAEPAAVQQQDVLGVLLSLDQQAYGGDDALSRTFLPGTQEPEPSGHRFSVVLTWNASPCDLASHIHKAFSLISLSTS